MIKLLKIFLIFEKPKDNVGLSSLQAFNLSLAAKFGAGNILGIACAINIGGPGTIFWIWVSALFSIALTLFENILSQVYKVQENDIYLGGPAYWISRGLKKYKIAILFSIIITIIFPVLFNLIQSQMIISIYKISIDEDLRLPITALVLILSFIFLGGVRRISHIIDIILPIVLLSYLLFIVILFMKNGHFFSHIVKLIFKDAFGPKTTFIGSVIMIVQGIKQGFLFNGSATGSASIAGATANVRHPVNQSIIQVIAVFINVFIIESGIAYLILVSQLYNTGMSSGYLLLKLAITEVTGQHFTKIIAIFFIITSFISILSNYFYGLVSFSFIFKKRKWLLSYIFLSLITILVGLLIYDVKIILSVVVILLLLLSIFTIFSIIKLKFIIFEVLRNYIMQLNLGKNPEFYLDNFPELKDMNPRCWQFREYKNIIEDTYFTIK